MISLGMTPMKRISLFQSTFSTYYLRRKVLVHDGSCQFLQPFHRRPFSQINGFINGHVRHQDEMSQQQQQEFESKVYQPTKSTSSSSSSSSTTTTTTVGTSKGHSNTGSSTGSGRRGGGSSRSSSTRSGNDKEDQDVYLQGQVLDLAVDLRTLRPGDRLEIPYEITVSESMQDFWQSAFHSQDRIHTSRPFCRTMGLQDRVLPFSLALFLTSSMSHEDSAKTQVGFGDVSYLWPAFSGDTFTKTFTMASVRNTSDGHHSVIHFTCDLINQRGNVCMRADKRMMFGFSFPDSAITADAKEPPPGKNPVQNLFRDHLVSKADVCQQLQSHSLVDLSPGTLILHSMQRSLTFTQSQQLASMAKLTHERHFDCRKFDIPTEITIPGGLVLGIAMSASARDFHELLHEEILSVNYVNTLHPGNVVGAISYVQSVEDVGVGDLERVTVRTLGIKNLDVKQDLKEVGIPLELLEISNRNKRKFLKPKDVEQICKLKCPQLQNKIVVQVDRRILRQARHKEVFLL